MWRSSQILAPHAELCLVCAQFRAKLKSSGLFISLYTYLFLYYVSFHGNIQDFEEVDKIRNLSQDLSNGSSPEGLQEEKNLDWNIPSCKGKIFASVVVISIVSVFKYLGVF